jgi:hypothetical protein
MDDSRTIDRQEPQGLRIEHPHGDRVLLEQQAIGVIGTRGRGELLYVSDTDGHSMGTAGPSLMSREVTMLSTVSITPLIAWLRH